MEFIHNIILPSDILSVKTSHVIFMDTKNPLIVKLWFYGERMIDTRCFSGCSRRYNGSRQQAGAPLFRPVSRQPFVRVSKHLPSHRPIFYFIFFFRTPMTTAPAPHMRTNALQTSREVLSEVFTEEEVFFPEVSAAAGITEGLTDGICA